MQPDEIEKLRSGLFLQIEQAKAQRKQQTTLAASLRAQLKATEALETQLRKTETTLTNEIIRLGKMLRGEQ